VVTLLFLQPIYNVLGSQPAAVVQHSASHRSLQTTKWMTLAGASLAVVSSTALYINIGLFIVLGDHGKPFYANPYLHVYVFGFNQDSAMNDVGMLLASGVIKKFWTSLMQKQSTTVPVNVAPLAHHGLSSGAALHPPLFPPKTSLSSPRIIDL
jgi:hypothetical protein